MFESAAGPSSSTRTATRPPGLASRNASSPADKPSGPRENLSDRIVNPGGPVKPDPRRALPAVDRLVRALEALTESPPVWALREAAREVLETERDRLAEAAPEPPEAAS